MSQRAKHRLTQPQIQVGLKTCLCEVQATQHTAIGHLCATTPRPPQAMTQPLITSWLSPRSVPWDSSFEGEQIGVESSSDIYQLGVLVGKLLIRLGFFLT